ncbi:arginine--tRNA ligase [Clostridium saccharoperbutylacetonicum]|uniref:arginine--tRNA ligase n=1 Tax=Clostridium saccharoperbutylacetonicum TaxID=36745 RepID=UPI000983F9AF|nr:arginine--tRNA ligase [Clostridium saccharoperbutylacetonicum]AQR97168.1 arginine--tRNA ligase [Clostridium saccharoperbutylacetonicum]NSB33049.1 arginyl-tRNA synthetase [Clostridium saccharoperbutylacetonicum]
MKNLVIQLTELVQAKFESLGYDKEYGKVEISNRPDLCQYQCNGALKAAKVYKKAPIAIANEVAEVLKQEEVFADITAVAPGFININIKDGFLTNYINDIYKDEKFGCTVAENPMTIVVDYGGANIAKPLHVGHLRSAIIGESIKRIGRYLGHSVIGDVHLGDWGLQIGMVITEVQRRHPELPYFDENFTGEYPEAAPFTIDELEDIYPAASKLAKSDEEAMALAKKATAELQEGKKGYIALWKHIINVSVSDLKRNYAALNVEFDLWKGESDANPYIEDMIKYFNDNNYTHVSEGALVIEVEEETDKKPMPPIIIQKSDGASLYGTTDLATIIERVRDYNPKEIIYVVDKRQGLHFEQVFRCARKTKIVSDELNFEFVGFGTMNGKDGKPFKTREGGVMRLQDLISIIKGNVKERLNDNDRISADEVDEIARIVGLSALKYGDLSNMPTKDYIFDIDKFSSFEGNTGPYILYTAVRIKSILNKAKEELGDFASEIKVPATDVERDLMLAFVRFNSVVESTFKDKSPNRLCEFIYEISNLFNRFYHENRILTEEDKEKKVSWLNLLALTVNILETALDLLGMEVPDKM